LEHIQRGTWNNKSNFSLLRREMFRIEVNLNNLILKRHISNAKTTDQNPPKLKIPVHDKDLKSGEAAFSASLKIQPRRRISPRKAFNA
jgi:hypothetical protein